MMYYKKYGCMISYIHIFHINKFDILLVNYIKRY
nr:MAG TPA: hypothetical protein [Caudoviricetes sp.]